MSMEKIRRQNMDDEQYINIEDGLSVGAVKYLDANEIITAEELNYIKNI